MKGSYTVEAALLMGILLPLLTGTIGTGIYMKARAEVYGRALELACEAALMGETGADGVTLNENSVSASVSREIPVLPLEKQFFHWPKTVTGSCTLERKNPAETVFRIHSLKKVIRQVTE